MNEKKIAEEIDTTEFSQEFDSYSKNYEGKFQDNLDEDGYGLYSICIDGASETLANLVELIKTKKKEASNTSLKTVTFMTNFFRRLNAIYEKGQKDLAIYLQRWVLDYLKDILLKIYACEEEE